MKNLFSFLTFVGLAACGADGDPVAKDTGVTVSGTATIGVSGSF